MRVARIVGSMTALGALALLGACATKTETVRDALARDDVAAARAVAMSPECTEKDADKERGCLAALAKALGSKEAFNPTNPDQAGAAAVAVLLVRERRGDWVSAMDKWILAVSSAKGVGADALRLAMATRMAEIAPRLGKKIDDDTEAAALVRELGTAFPGACPTYAKVPADPAMLDAMAAPEHPDHAPCVQRDLMRARGSGPSYGYGVWRALEAATALWHDERRALAEGASLMTGKPRASLDRKLAIIDDASQRIDTKRVAVPGNAWAHGAGSAMHQESAAIATPSASALGRPPLSSASSSASGRH